GHMECKISQTLPQGLDFYLGKPFSVPQILQGVAQGIEHEVFVAQLAVTRGSQIEKGKQSAQPIRSARQLSQTAAKQRALAEPVEELVGLLLRELGHTGELPYLCIVQRQQMKVTPR